MVRLLIKLVVNKVHHFVGRGRLQSPNHHVTRRIATVIEPRDHAAKPFGKIITNFFIRCDTKKGGLEPVEFFEYRQRADRVFLKNSGPEVVRQHRRVGSRTPTWPAAAALSRPPAGSAARPRSANRSPGPGTPARPGPPPPTHAPAQRPPQNAPTSARRRRPALGHAGQPLRTSAARRPCRRGPHEAQAPAGPRISRSAAAIGGPTCNRREPGPVHVGHGETGLALCHGLPHGGDGEAGAMVRSPAPPHTFAAFALAHALAGPQAPGDGGSGQPPAAAQAGQRVEAGVSRRVSALPAAPPESRPSRRTARTRPGLGPGSAHAGRRRRPP